MRLVANKKNILWWLNGPYSQLIYLVWAATVLLSALKNIFFWDYIHVHNPKFFHFPVFEIFRNVPQNLDLLLLIVGCATCILLFSGKGLMRSIPFVVNGVINFYLQSSDYLGLHHDMLLSSMLFTAYGIYIALTSDPHKKFALQTILAIVASTYFISGVVKINPDFLSGEIVETIISRAQNKFYWPMFKEFLPYSSLFAWFAMIVEIVEPVLLVFFAGAIKLYTILLAFPFHLGILLTGTGTVYNLIYPASFLLLLEQDIAKMGEKYQHLFVIYRAVAFIFLLFAFLYIFQMLISILRKLI